MTITQAQSATILQRLKDYSQNAIFDALQKYIETRKALYDAAVAKFRQKGVDVIQYTVDQHIYLPFNDYSGICAGLTALWLYEKFIDEEGKFIHMLHHLLTWNADNLKKIAAAVNKPASLNTIQDEIIEKFMHLVLFIQHHIALDESHEARDMHESINFITDDLPQINPEFDISFVFTRKTLADLLLRIKVDGSMLRFANGFHTIGGFYKDGYYYLYNSSNKHGLLQTKNINEFADLVFNELSMFCKSKDYIALNIIAFGSSSENSKSTIYPDVTSYCEHLCKDKKYMRNAFKHPNFLRILTRYSPTVILPFALHEGFKPVTTEYRGNILSEVIEMNKINTMKLLLTHNIDVSNKKRNAESLLGSAIRLQRIEMIYLLLMHGINPNMTADGIESPVNYAIRHGYDKFETLVLLLAFGANPSTLFIELLDDVDNKRTFRSVTTQALELNKKLVELQHIDQKIGTVIQAKLNALLDKIANPFLIKENTPNLVKAINATIKDIRAKNLEERTPEEISQIEEFTASLDKLMGAGSLSSAYIKHYTANARKHLAEYMKPYSGSNVLRFSASSAERDSTGSIQSEFQDIVLPVLAKLTGKRQRL